MIETLLTAYLFVAMPVSIVAHEVTNGAHAAIAFGERTAVDTVMLPVTIYDKMHPVTNVPYVAPVAPPKKKTH